MKRFGKKTIKEALEAGAAIHVYKSFSLYGACYRVVMDGEHIGYITYDLHWSLKSDGEIIKSGEGFDYSEYTRAKETEKITAEEWNEASERVHAAVLASLPETVEAEPEETEQERTDRENRAHCKRIADELEAYADGTVYRCPECGEVIQWDNAQYNDDEGLYTCQCCGESFDECDLEPLGVYDFIADAFDIEISCSLDREYRSARVMVAFGGPSIYIDTARKAVELYWWTDRAEYPISSDAADALDEAIAECWEVR